MLNAHRTKRLTRTVDEAGSGATPTILHYMPNLILYTEIYTDLFLIRCWLTKMLRSADMCTKNNMLRDFLKLGFRFCHEKVIRLMLQPLCLVETRDFFQPWWIFKHLVHIITRLRFRVKEMFENSELRRYKNFHKLFLRTNNPFLKI